MKTKIYVITIFFFIGINIVQAQIRGQLRFKHEVIKTEKVNCFDKIISDESFYTKDIGSPELPIVLKSYLIPIDADQVTINVQNISKQKVEGEYFIYPTQPPVTTSITKSISFVNPNPDIYESEVPFPNKPIEIISDEFYMGYRIITIQLCLLEYIPRKRELYNCNIDFSIDYTLVKSLKNETVSITQSQTIYRHELNKKAVKFQIENPEAVDNYDTKVENIVQGKNIVYSSSSDLNNSSNLCSQSTGRKTFSIQTIKIKLTKADCRF